LALTTCKLIMKPTRSRIRRIFAAGLLVIGPISVTLFLVYKLVQWTDDILHFAIPLPPLLAKPGLGLIFLAALVFLVGLITTNIAGRKVVEFGERILKRIPVINSIYSGVKTLVEAFTMPSSGAFKQVVLIEYPRKGAWALGFVTNEVGIGGRGIAGPDKLNIFVPTAPNPTSGMVIVVERDDAIYLDLSVKEAIEFIVSGGVLYPSEKMADGKSPARVPSVSLPSISVFKRVSAKTGRREERRDPRAV